MKPLDQLASVRLDHSLGCNVVGVAGQLYVLKPFKFCLREQQL
jgi:hypothetical protein